MREQALGAGLLAGSQFSLSPFRLHQPTTPEEAFEAYRNDPDAVLLSGSTDAIVRMREGLSPRVVVALRGVTSWREIDHEGDVLRVGALATHRSGPADQTLRNALPSFAEAWSGIATVRIRNRATIGGNVMARQCRYETPVMLASLDAELEVFGVDGPSRATLPDLWNTAAPLAGILHHVSIPLGGLLLFSYERTLRPLLTVALVARQHAARIALVATVGSEYHQPVTVRGDLAAATLDDIDAERAGRDLADQIPEGIGDYAANAGYRRRVVAVLVRRQLVAAQSRAHSPEAVVSAPLANP